MENCSFEFLLFESGAEMFLAGLVVIEVPISSYIKTKEKKC